MATGEQTSATAQAKQKTGEMAGQAQEKAQQAAGQAKEQVQQAAGQARRRGREQLDQRSTQVGQQIRGQAGDVRSVAEQLRQQGKDKPARLADQAADRAERVGAYLEESDADRILGDVEEFARQRPWAVVAAGLMLGFAASRFLKASSTERYQRSLAQRPIRPRVSADRTPPAERAPRAGYPTGTGAI